MVIYPLACIQEIRMKIKTIANTLLLVALLQIAACTKSPPRHVNNICSIFLQYPTWYWATQEAESQWGIPIPVQMAIIHQESRFNGTAKPPRTRLLWIIPWKRPSTSYGYTQALEITWENYRNHRGGRRKRDAFEDATDFIGWYSQVANDRAGISKRDAFHLYLAYHEGVGGYIRGTYRNKQWLINVAKKVNRRALQFSRQLTACHSRLPQKPWYRFW